MLTFETLVTLLVTGMACGVISVTYTEILSRELILNWWFRFGARYEKRWFWKPIWGCEKCVAGQMAFWTFLYPYLKAFFSPFYGMYHVPGYSIVHHALTVCIAIISALVINKALYSYKILH